ncbi:MAG: type II toxin-antitoxin system mRNA interferase toxin, RelE/StbE family [bacterium]|nr:type II toxin-antitoxin system mRNA interferase toxin, RelE/StbE family [bacterium]
MRIWYSGKFERLYAKLPEDVKLLAETREKIFLADPFDARLRTHKLHGRFAGFLAFSLNYKYRVVFDFYKDDIVRFHAIGLHDIYE